MKSWQEKKANVSSWRESAGGAVRKRPDLARAVLGLEAVVVLLVGLEAVTRALTLPPWSRAGADQLAGHDLSKPLSRATSSRTLPLRSSSATRVQSVIAARRGIAGGHALGEPARLQQRRLLALASPDMSACGAKTAALAAPERARNCRRDCIAADLSLEPGGRRVLSAAPSVCRFTHPGEVQAKDRKSIGSVLFCDAAMDPLIIVFGLGVGILVGLTGIGGGSLMTPLLLIVIGTQPVVAVGTDIAYGALTKTVGGWQHLRNKTVDLGVSFWLAVGSCPGAVGGVILVESLPSPPDEALLWGVAGALAPHRDHHARPRAVHPRRRASEERESVRAHHDGEGHGGRPRARARLHPRRHLGRQRRADRPGADPRLPAHAAPRRRHRRLPRRRAAVGGRLAHAVAGNVDYGLMGNILIGSIPGVLVGERLARASRAAGLRPALGATMLAAALGVASKAGLDLPAYAILGPPLSRSRPPTCSRARATAAPRSPRSRARAAQRRCSQSGMLPCLRFGPCTRLVRSVSSAAISFGRVSCGTITSSM